MKRWIHAATQPYPLQIEFDGLKTQTWDKDSRSGAPSRTDYLLYFHVDLDSSNIASLSNIFDDLFESAYAEVSNLQDVADDCQIYLVINYIDGVGYTKAVTWRMGVDTANVSNVGYITVSPGKVFERGSAKDIQQRLVSFSQQYQSKPLSNYTKKKCIDATLDYFAEQD